jgi:hypothetical protein
MSKSIYVETLCNLLIAVENFKAGEISLECYQSEVVKAEYEIVSIEERALRELLLNHENEIELFRFTTEDQSLIKTNVDKFQNMVRLWL